MFVWLLCEIPRVYSKFIFHKHAGEKNTNGVIRQKYNRNRRLNGKAMHFFGGGIQKKQHPKHQDLSSYPWGVSTSHPCVAHGSNPGRKMQIGGVMLYHSFKFKWVASFQIMYVNLCFMSSKKYPLYHFKIIIFTILKDPILDLRLIPWLSAWTHIVERACPMESR